MGKHLIGKGLPALLRHPEERRRLQGDPGLLHGAIEKILRYDGPVQRTSRTLAVGPRRGSVLPPWKGSRDWKIATLATRAVATDRSTIGPLARAGARPPVRHGPCMG